MNRIGDYFDPQDTVEDRWSDPRQTRYIRSYLRLRLLIGVLGIALPFVLVAGDAVVFDSSPILRDSLSEYYYSGMREVFVAVLSATGVFLVSYKIAEVSLDNTLSTFAGVGAIVVALLPTERPDPSIPLTALQDTFGETFVSVVHFLAAAVFIVSLGILSASFGDREGEADQRGKHPPAVWQWFHWTCTGLMALALVWIVLTWLFGGPRTALFWGEAVAAVAFGASWLVKGAEMDVVLNRPGRPGL